MAIYHLSIKIFSRGKGASAVAKAAYRSAECIKSEYDGLTSDYTHKKGVIHTEILLPENAPKEYADRAVLWNAVEKCERYKTAQLAREIEVSLPKELTREQNLFLVREYVKKHFVNEGMCADLCIHDKGDGNPHAHIMLTLRSLDKNGRWLSKSHTVDGIKMPTNDWSNRTNAEIWRQAWAETVNGFLEHHDHAAHIEKIDHRSYERQGIDQIPTVHLGAAACQMERRGIATDKGNRNREIAITNNQLRQLKARINKLSDWIKEESETAKPTTLADVIQQTLERKVQEGKSQNYQSINNIKAAAKMLNFLTDNHITDVVGLNEKVKVMYEKQSDLREKLKPIDRRLKTLDEHITQADYYFEFKAIYQKYKGINPKYQADFREDNRREITLYEAAERYIDGVMNGKRPIPRKAWKVEREKLTSERNILSREYYSLKDEVKEVERIKRSVEGILRESVRENKAVKKREYGLE